MFLWGEMGVFFVVSVIAVFGPPLLPEGPMNSALSPVRLSICTSVRLQDHFF